MTDEQATAYHEAGHAVVMAWHNRAIRHVSIVPTGDAAGFVIPGKAKQELEERGAILSASGRIWVENEIVICLAGGLAAERLTGEPYEDPTVPGSDYWQATNLAVMVCRSQEETDAFLQWLLERTKNVIALPAIWEAIEDLAAALLADKSLSGRKARRLIRRYVP